MIPTWLRTRLPSWVTRAAATVVVLACLGATPTGCAFLKSREPAPAGDNAYNPYQDAAGVRMGQAQGARAAYRDRKPVTQGGSGMDFDPSVSVDGKFLVFASTRWAEKPDIYKKAADSHALMLLTSDPAADINPVLSPDNQWVAFTSDREGSFDIYVKRVDDEDPSRGSIRVTRDTTDEIHPSWAPDGKRLVYCAYSPTAGNWHMWIVSPFDRSVAIDIGEGLFPAWSPATDPSHPSYETIAFQRHRMRDTPWYSVWTIRTDGTRLREVAWGPDYGMITPNWSPDGDWIAFAAVHPDRQARFSGWWKPDGTRQKTPRGWNAPPPADNVLMVRADGTGMRQLIDDASADWCPSWGRDGRLYYVSDRLGRPQIWSVVPTLVDERP